MNANDRELLLKDETDALGGAAMEVSNELGAGFLEAVYQEAVRMELKNRTIPLSLSPPDIRVHSRPLAVKNPGNAP